MQAVLSAAPPEVDLSYELLPGGDLALHLAGRLDARTAASVWEEALAGFERHPAPLLVLQAGALEALDSVGAGLLIELKRRQVRRGGRVKVRGLRRDLAKLVGLFWERHLEPLAEPRPRPGFVEELGRATAALADDLAQLVSFVGELSTALAKALARPRRLRWRVVLQTAERVGFDALPIAVTVHFLMGLVLAFEAAQAMAVFGAQVFVPNLVGLSTVRELGPLMTAILLAGRSGSSFAAELGTMKVREEIDALSTMGLDPLTFLAVPRVLAALIATPVLALLGIACSLAGGAVVFLSLGFPLITYVQQVRSAVELSDLAAGLTKALVFGLLVAGVGCLRGLQTRSGASAVGGSATRAVVSAIFLIVFADALFSFVYHALGV